MIQISLTPTQICSYYSTASKNFANQQPNRFWCHSKNAEKCDKYNLDNDPDFTESNSTLFWFESRLQADVFYNFICEHTDNDAYCCSDETDYDLNYVVCVNINIFDTDIRGVQNLVTMKTEQVC